MSRLILSSVALLCCLGFRIALAGDLPEPKWERAETATSPKGGVKFHGEFGNEAVSVQQTGLGDHEFVRIEVELLILRTWDGSVPLANGAPSKDGPDFLQVVVDNERTLLATTFSNLPKDDPGFIDVGKTQNFPSPIPGDRVNPQSGALIANSMGYRFPWPGPPQVVWMDATYHLELLVPHDKKTMELTISASGLSEIKDEAWGVGSVKFIPLTTSQMQFPNKRGIAAAFETALDRTSRAQPAAVNTLVSGKDLTVGWLKNNVDPAGIDADEVAAALKKLDETIPQTPEGEAAIDALATMGPAVEPYLRDAARDGFDDERDLIGATVRQLIVTPITDDKLRRVALATRVLEIIGHAGGDEVAAASGAGGMTMTARFRSTTCALQLLVPSPAYSWERVRVRGRVEDASVSTRGPHPNPLPLLRERGPEDATL